MERYIIKKQSDAEAFFARYGGLHDGIVTVADYRADIKADGKGSQENWQGHTMTLVILSADLGAPMVELTFQGVLDWHIRCCGQRISLFGLRIEVGDNGVVTVTDSYTTEGEAFRDSNYVRAACMAWRELSSNRVFTIGNGRHFVSMEIVKHFPQGPNQPWEAYRMRVWGKGTYSTFDMLADVDRRSLEGELSSLCYFRENSEGTHETYFSRNRNLRLKMEFELTGRVKVAVDIHDVPQEQNQCHIEFYTDQTFIAQSIEQLKQMLFCE